MKIVTFEYEGREQVGVVSACETVVHPMDETGLPYHSVNELIEHMSKKEAARLKANVSGKGGIPLSDVTLLAPIPEPRQDIICLGINYMAHAEESARYKKEEFNGERPYAVYFSKRCNEAVGHGGRIPAHTDLTKCLDYEAELAVIIGKEARNVPKAEAADYIFGYTIINDISAREVQNRHKQWYFGKGMDGFVPMGPWIVTAEDIAFPPKLQIQSYVNGQLRQNSNTELQIFDIAHVISELSQGMTLKPGTIIATGTPAGVGMGFDPPKFLKSGDVVECRIEGIGSLKNTVE